MPCCKTILDVDGKEVPVFSFYSFGKLCAKKHKGITEEFSSLKYGHYGSIKKWTAKLSLLIKKTLPRTSFFIVSNPSDDIRNIASYLAENVSKSLRKHTMCICSKPWPKRKRIYSDLGQKEKEKLCATLKYYNGPRLDNKNVIIIDDCMTTGTALKTCIRLLLKNGAGNIFCFTCIKAGSPKIERAITLSKVKRKKILFMSKILKNKKNPLVSRMINALLALPPRKFAGIIKTMGKTRRKEILQAMQSYKESHKGAKEQRKK